METTLLVIHLLIAIFMIASILLQRSENSGFTSSMGSLMTGRSAANALTRITSILAICFFLTSIVLAILAGGSLGTRSIVDALDGQSIPQTMPQEPTIPSVPSQN